MTQPMPQMNPKSQPVGPALKRRFNDWIDQRTAKGMETYGTPLQTHNGRSAEQDMIEELLDFAQYQEQSRMELADRVQATRYAAEPIGGKVTQTAIPGYQDMLLLAREHEELQVRCGTWGGSSHHGRDLPCCQGRGWTLPPAAEWLGLLVDIALNTGEGIVQIIRQTKCDKANIMQGWYPGATTAAALAAALVAAKGLAREVQSG